MKLLHGDCVEVMAGMAEASVDAIVTDPPYGLEFMGKAWDRLWVEHADGRQGRINGQGDMDTWPKAPQYRAGIAAQQWHERWAREALRVLKPGGHALVFGGTRMVHRLTCGLEDAGFEIRDCLQWLFGSGFPKSLDVSKAIDRAAGAERVLTRAGTVERGGLGEDWDMNGSAERPRYDEPATDAARQWDGWGTALKPAYEPIVLARKPLVGTVAANVLRYGTGGLNIDGCRIDSPVFESEQRTSAAGASNFFGLGADGGERHHPVGRWPANVVLSCACDGRHDADCAVALLDAASGTSTSMVGEPRSGVTSTGAEYGDSGGASRFFYTAKSSRSEREFGLEDLPPHTPGELTDRKDGAAGTAHPRAGAGRAKRHGIEDLTDLRMAHVQGRTMRRNDHPTVKPVALMRWLCRLVTPPGGIVLDPFCGSGSTGMAALDEGFEFIGIDQDEHYLEIARKRIEARHLLEPAMKPPTETKAQGTLV